MNDRYMVWARHASGLAELVGAAGTEAEARLIEFDVPGAAFITDEDLGITLVTNRITSLQKLERAFRAYQAALRAA